MPHDKDMDDLLEAIANLSRPVKQDLTRKSGANPMISALDGTSIPPPDARTDANLIGVAPSIQNALNHPNIGETA